MTLQEMRRIMSDKVSEEQFEVLMAVDMIENCCQRIKDAAQHKGMMTPYILRQLEMIERKCYSTIVGVNKLTSQRSARGEETT